MLEPSVSENCGWSDRFSVTSLDFAQKLHALLTPHLPSFPYPTSIHPKRRVVLPEGTPRHPHSFNSNIRVYKYTEGQYFGYVESKPLVRRGLFSMPSTDRITTTQ